MRIVKEFDSIPDAIDYAERRAKMIAGGQRRSQALIQRNGMIRVIVNHGLTDAHRPMMVVRPVRSRKIVPSAAKH